MILVSSTSFKKKQFNCGSLKTGPFVLLTLGQMKVKCIVNLLNLSASLDALKVVPELPQFDVEVNFVLSTRELSTTSTG